MSEEPRQPQDKYILRLPDGMRDRLKDEAAKNKRSLNAEIIDRLEATFVMDETMSTHEKEMADIRKTVNELKVGFALMQKQQKP
jgi:plasmid stability protein